MERVSEEFAVGSGRFFGFVSRTGPEIAQSVAVAGRVGRRAARARSQIEPYSAVQLAVRRQSVQIHRRLTCFRLQTIPF